jgi:hypothetical protein
MADKAGIADRQDSLPFVDAWMNFSGPIEGRARVDVPDWSRTNMALERHDLRFHDARPLAGSLSLDREGFTLAAHDSGLAESCDLPAVASDYLASVAELVRDIMGADLVLPQGKGLLKRHAESARREGAIGPSRWVHMDYTTDAAHKWVGWMEGWHGRPLHHYSRFAILQTWRCLTPPPCDNTLVLCDASSIAAEDCIVFDAVIAKPYDEPGNQFESQFARFNPDQRWYYFSDLRPDELIVFKGFDSDPDKFAQPLHNSIDLPIAAAGARPRCSVEARFFAFFE